MERQGARPSKFLLANQVIMVDWRHRRRRQPRKGPPATIVAIAVLGSWLFGAMAQDISVDALSCSAGKLCAFDTRTRNCTVSRSYTESVFNASAGNEKAYFKSIYGHAARCDALGKQGTAFCEKETGCEVDTMGHCVTSQRWMITTLGFPRAAGGAGLGLDDSCGFVGQLLTFGATCQFFPDSESCDVFASKNDSLKCRWNSDRNICEVAPTTSLAMLRQRDISQMEFIAARRLRCSMLDQPVCSGSCRWVAGACDLALPEAFMALVGENCPLQPFFLLHTSCSSAYDPVTCRSGLRSDGLPRCAWMYNKRCEAHPIGLELDLMTSMGLRTYSTAQLLVTAEMRCASLGDSLTKCTSECAPMRTGRSVKSWRMPTIMFPLLLFCWLVVTL